MDRSVPRAGAPRRPFLLLALLCAAQLIVILDITIVNVALPAIGSDLELGPADLSWVGNAYTLALGGFLLLGGRASDLFGRRAVFLTGLGLFTVALVYAIIGAEEHGFFAPRTIALVALAAVLLVAFVAVEGRVRQPLVRLSVFRVRALAIADSAYLVVSMGMFGPLILLSLYLQRVLGLSPLEAGLAFLPYSIAFGAVASLAVDGGGRRGRHPRRHGRHRSGRGAGHRRAGDDEADHRAPGRPAGDRRRDHLARLAAPGPGETVFTRMPCGANSSDSALVRLFRPAFAAP